MNYIRNEAKLEAKSDMRTCFPFSSIFHQLLQYVSIPWSAHGRYTTSTVMYDGSEEIRWILITQMRSLEMLRSGETLRPLRYMIPTPPQPLVRLERLCSLESVVHTAAKVECTLLRRLASYGQSQCSVTMITSEPPSASW